MYSRVITGAVHGIDSVLATVEVDASKGMPGIEMVGQLDNAVREAKERVRWRKVRVRMLQFHLERGRK